jgi:RNA polymerase sigma-70 factor (ECF subfamily)
MNKPAMDASNEEHGGMIDPSEIRQWVRQAQAGDQEAFGRLMQTYHQRVFGLVYGMVNQADDAQELVQQTWIKAWTKLHTFKGDAEFFTWVYRIASYASLDFLRKRKRQREDPIPETGAEPARNLDYEVAPSVNPRPDRQAMHAEIKQRFEEALRDLTPEHRMALVLREIDGLSYDDIARVMKCRKGTVMSRIFYARKRLQEQMKDYP